MTRRGLLILVMLAAVPTSSWAAPRDATCPFVSQDRTVRDCEVPADFDIRKVRISSELTAHYQNYQIPNGPAGVRMEFFAGGERLRTVLLAINRPDEETDSMATVDLRKKLPEYSNVTSLQFEGTRTSVTVRIIYSNSKVGNGVTDVWSAN